MLHCQLFDCRINKTITSVTFDGSDSVEAVVDELNPTDPTESTATTLLAAIQSGLEALFSTSITYSTIDSDLVTDFITEELNIINETDDGDTMTAAERLAAQQELDTFLSENYGDNTFEHVYINSKLTELAEKHYLNGHKTAAKELYELSLNYLSDQENVVSGSLFRMAYYETADLTDESTVTEIANAVTAYKTTSMRFFDYFPDSTTNIAESVYSRIMMEHYKRFSTLLTYDNYQTTIYNNAAAACTALLTINNDTNHQSRAARVTAWELVQLTVNFANSDSEAMTGTVTVTNVTAETDKKNVFYNSEDAAVEARTFTIENGSVTIPVYAGHVYNMTVSFDVEGGNALVYTVEAIPHTAGTLLTCDHYSTPVVSALTGANSTAQADFIFDQPDYPYNLTWEQYVDVFNLSWDWVAPEGFVVDHYVVYRGNTAIATVTEQEANGIPYENDEGVYTYKVIAYDASGNASVASQTVTITLPDMSQFSDYLEWRETYFGENLQFATDDSDGDSSDNYSEYLAGTDPTRIPGTEWMEAGQVTYTKITLKWDKIYGDDADVTYTVYRDGEEVGSATTETFTDSELTPGISYTYTVAAVNNDTGGETEEGMALSIRTSAEVEFTNSDAVRQVVDSLNPIDVSEYTATTLIAAVKSGLEAILGTTITFTTVDEDILNDFVTTELELLGEEEDELTNAEKLTAQTEISDFLDENYNGNSFAHMYINAKLTELAEKHYLNGNTAAALELFEASLLYLKDCENIVSGTLSRLARIKIDAITDASTNAEIIAALDASRDQYLRFFNYFEDSSSTHAISSYTRPAMEYFKYFPALLTYENYTTSVFNSANDLAKAALELDSSTNYQTRADRIAAWELGSITVNFADSNGEALTGTLVVKNTSDKNLIWNYEENTPVNRTYSFANCPLTIPVYLGHSYDFVVTLEVDGGNALVWTYENVPHALGQSVAFDNYTQGETSLLDNSSAAGELNFVLDQPTYPYNLTADTLVDSFDLTWDWTNTDSLTAVGYKVYRGGVELADVTEKTLTGIAIENENNYYNYTVRAYDTDGNLSASSQELIVMPPDATDQITAYYAWKKKYFGTNPAYSYEDPDGDGLTNWEEFLLGTNPTVAPGDDPKANLTEIQSGLLVKYYSGEYSSLPTFSSLESFKEEVLSEFQFSTSSTILNSELGSYLAMTMEGFFDVPADGTYRFYLGSADGSKLYINGSLVVANDRTHSEKEYRNNVVLNEGTNTIKIEYFNRTTNPAVLKVDWSGPGFDRTDITDRTWYTSESDAVFEEVIAWQRDTDLDGIRDVDEKTYGTDFEDSDTDGDGISDGDEVYIYNTDPTLVDTDGDSVSDYEEIFMSNSDALTPDMDLSDIETVLSVDAADYSSYTGTWNKISSTQIYCNDSRGSVSYSLEIPQDYTYRLKISAQEYYPLERDANIKVFVDGVYVGQKVVTLDSSQFTDIYFYLPWLASGTHTVKVWWDNYLSASHLRLKNLELEKIGGTDSNENSIADWIEDGMNKVCSFTEITSSRVSPAFVEGSAQYPDLVTINNTTVNNGSGDEWYANVALNENSSTTVAVNFQNGGKTITQTIDWTQTNIIQENGTSLTIRAGDSLLFNAYPTDATDGQYTISYNSQDYTETINTPKAIAFSDSGTYTVTATYTAEDGTTASGSVTVNVVSYAFSSTEPACWVLRTRSWDVPEMPDGVVIDPDDRFDTFEASDVELDGYIRYDITIDANRDRFVLARLGEGGPVLAQKKIKGFYIYSSNKTYVRQVDEYEDGTILYEMLVISSPILSDVSVKLRIFVAGVTFDDGTTVKELTADDFDSAGQTKVNFLYSPEATTSTCHNLKCYQNGTYIGIRY